MMEIPRKFGVSQSRHQLAMKYSEMLHKHIGLLFYFKLVYSLSNYTNLNANYTRIWLQ